MMAVTINGKIRIGDDFVQAATGKTEFIVPKIVKGIEYQIEICAPIDRWTAERIVKNLK